MHLTHSCWFPASEVRLFMQYKNRYIKSNNHGTAYNPTSVHDCMESCLADVSEGTFNNCIDCCLV